MDRLILLRHGKTERNAQSGEDVDRALTEQGRAAAAAMGRRLAVTGSNPDLALVSSAVRAVQTFEAVRPAFAKVAVRTDSGLYLATAAQLHSAVLAAAEDGRILLLVGHNPGIHELALRFAYEGEAGEEDMARLERGFPTSAAAVFQRDAGEVLRLQALHLPRTAP